MRAFPPGVPSFVRYGAPLFPIAIRASLEGARTFILPRKEPYRLPAESYVEMPVRLLNVSRNLEGLAGGS